MNITEKSKNNNKGRKRQAEEYSYELEQIMNEYNTLLTIYVRQFSSYIKSPSRFF